MQILICGYNDRMKLKCIIVVSLICSMILCSCGPDPGSSESYHAEGAENYNKDAIIEKYSGDLDSDLSVFPDDIFADKTEYTADFNPNLFDTDGKMILICTYGDEKFSDEISRLQALSKTIEYNDEEHTNNVIYDEDSYSYPAYITIDGFGNTYEYALIDQSNNRIVYVYLAYPDKKTLQDYSDYIKKDLSVYEEENTWDVFSMHNHSFDGGESWVEFDDEVTMIATDEGEETTE